MGIWESFNNLLRSEAQRLSLVMLSHDHVYPQPESFNSASLAGEDGYFRLWIEEMFLRYDRTLVTEWYPAIQSIATFTFGSGLQDLTITGLAGPNQLKSSDPTNLGQVITRQTRLTPLVPFKGGTVELGVSLYRFKADNLLRRFLDVVGDLSTLVALPQLSGALNIASSINNAVDQLLGGSGPTLIVGYQQTFASVGGGGTNDLRPGYVAVLNEPMGTHRADQLWVKGGQLCVGDGLDTANPLTGVDYMLLRIETRATRDDLDSLSPMKDLFDQAVNALSGMDTEKADMLLRSAQGAVASSPDLVRNDRFLLLKKLRETYNHFKEAMLGTGERGLNDLSETHLTLPTWEELVRSAFNEDNGAGKLDATGYATHHDHEQVVSHQMDATTIPGVQAVPVGKHQAEAGTEAASFDYHVLLIGIDNYSDPGKLQGCVNDIDTVEDILLRAGVGVHPEQIHITRLAAPLEGAVSSSSLKTKPPTRENILQALGALADPNKVKSGDRVLIYYAGHGSQVKWSTGSWHEALVPQDRQYIYDMELNPLLGKIAACTEDLTVILDCCHSAGATRDVEDSDNRVRFLSAGDDPVKPPAALLVAATNRSVEQDTGLARSMDPKHLVIAACQADELAKETTYNGKKHGWFTYGFTASLANRDSVQRGQLRWADIWPQMLDKLTRGGANPQHPWLIGRTERHIFGGTWHPQDAGFAVTRDAQGVYHVNAGTLMGVTVGAQLAVYGADPAIFPTLNSAEDQQARRGLLEIVTAGRTDSTAKAVKPFDLPFGARARLVKPGENEKLQVALNPPDVNISTELLVSPLLQVVPSGTSDADVRVSGNAQLGWTIGNNVEPNIATVRPNQVSALRAGLEAYDRYARVIRFARKCNDVALSGAIHVQVLDCNGIDPSVALTDEILDQLPEAPKRSDSSPYTGASYGGNYVLPYNFPFAIRLGNMKALTLYAKVLLCTAGGKVYYLGDTSVRPSDNEVLWQQQMRGLPWSAQPAMARKEATDRLVVLATTKPGVDLSTLQWEYNVQQVVDGESGDTRDVGPPSSEIPELWTAQVIPLVLTS